MGDGWARMKTRHDRTLRADHKVWLRASEKMVKVGDQQTVRGTLHIPLVTLSVLVYCAVLHLLYQYQVSPAYFTRGLTYRTPDWPRYTLAIFLVAVVAWCLPRQCRRASDYMQWFPFVIAGAPSILLPQYMQALDRADASYLAVSVAGSLLLCRALTFGQINAYKFQNTPVRRIWTILALVALAFYAYTAGIAGIPLRWISIGQEYEVRSSFVATVGGTLVPRLLPSFYNVVNPILMARGLFAKRPKLFLAGAGGQLLIYLWEGQKSVFLSIPLTIGLYFAFRNRDQICGYVFLLGSSALSLLSLALVRLQYVPGLTDLFLRRLTVIPGAMTVAYVAVFQTREKSHFAELRLGSANPSYITSEPAFAVGQLFFGDSSTHANVNIWGHGYMSLGYAGMFLMAAMYALVLRVLDASSEGLPTAVVGVIFAPLALVVSSANLFTALVTHGLWAMMLICLFLPRSGWNSKEDHPKDMMHNARSAES